MNAFELVAPGVRPAVYPMSSARPARRQSQGLPADPAAAARGREDAAQRRGESAARRARSQSWRQAYTRETGREPRAGLRRETEAAFGAVVWRSSSSLPSQLQEQIQRGVTSSTPPTTIAPPMTAEQALAIARQKAAEQRAASTRSYETYVKSSVTPPPAGLSERIAQANIEVEKRKAATAERNRVEAERIAKLFVPPKTPAANAGIREWEAYYKAVGMTPPSPAHRVKLELGEKTAFARATGGIWFIPQSFTQQSRVGVSRGVTWMFPVAYGKDSMPYWDLWFDKKATASQIGAMVAEDYKREIMRRAAIQAKSITEREGWQDARKPGPGPTIDPHEGIHSPITAPKTYSAVPGRRDYERSVQRQSSQQVPGAIVRKVEPALQAEQKASTRRALQKPAPDAGIRAWEDYHRTTKTRLSPDARRRIELAEKAALDRKRDIPAPRRPAQPLPSLRRPAGRPVQPLPALGQIPGGFSITRTTILDPRRGGKRILVTGGGQGFSSPVPSPWQQQSRWLQFQAGPSAFVRPLVRPAVGAGRRQAPAQAKPGSLQQRVEFREPSLIAPGPPGRTAPSPTPQPGGPQPSLRTPLPRAFQPPPGLPPPSPTPPGPATPQPGGTPPPFTTPSPEVPHRIVEARERLGLKGLWH